MGDSVGDAVGDGVGYPISEVGGSVGDAVGDAVGGLVGDSIRDSVGVSYQGFQSSQNQASAVGARAPRPTIKNEVAKRMMKVR